MLGEYIHADLFTSVRLKRDRSMRVNIGHYGSPSAAHVAIQNSTPKLQSTPPLRSNPYCGYFDHLPFFCGPVYRQLLRCVFAALH